MTPNTHPWRLASPWYRQDSVRGRTGRIASGAPVIQKYASPDPVTPFVDAPQRSLRFTGDDLLHHLFPTVTYCWTEAIAAASR
jgi:hypothetical protein